MAGLFLTQGILPPASRWLCNIASLRPTSSNLFSTIADAQVLQTTCSFGHCKLPSPLHCSKHSSQAFLARRACQVRCFSNGQDLKRLEVHDLASVFLHPIGGNKDYPGYIQDPILSILASTLTESETACSSNRKRRSSSCSCSSSFFRASNLGTGHHRHQVDMGFIQFHIQKMRGNFQEVMPHGGEHPKTYPKDLL